MNSSRDDSWVGQYSMETSASPETLWRLFSDVAGWKEWNAGIEQIEMRGDFVIGSEFVMTPPGQSPLLSRLIEVKENECFVDETWLDDLVVVVSHHLERLSGRTQVTYTVNATGPNCNEVGPAVSADFPEVLEALVRLAESQSRFRAHDPR